MSKGRIFKVPFVAIGVTAAAVLWEIIPAAGQGLTLLSIVLGQTSDMGDAEEEGMVLLVNRRTGAAATGTGSAVTPQPTTPGDTAAFTAKAPMSANGTGGTTTTVHAEPFNSRAGVDRVFTPEEQMTFTRASAGNGVGLEVKLNGAPTDSLTMSGTITLEEAPA